MGDAISRRRHQYIGHGPDSLSNALAARGRQHYCVADSVKPVPDNYAFQTIDKRTNRQAEGHRHRGRGLKNCDSWSTTGPSIEWNNPWRNKNDGRGLTVWSVKLTHVNRKFAMTGSGTSYRKRRQRRSSVSRNWTGLSGTAAVAAARPVMQSIAGHDVSVIAMRVVPSRRARPAARYLTSPTTVVDDALPAADSCCTRHMLSADNIHLASGATPRVAQQARRVGAVIGAIVSAWHSGTRSLLGGRRQR